METEREQTKNVSMKKGIHITQRYHIKNEPKKRKKKKRESPEWNPFICETREKCRHAKYKMKKWKKGNERKRKR